MNEEQIDGLINELKGLRRHHAYLNDYGLGAYIDFEIEDDGEYVRWDDIQEILNKFS